MTKRVPLSERREQDRKGVDAIVADTGPTTAAETTPSVPAVVVKSKLEKVTLYVRPEQVLGLEEIQLRERRRSGTKPDKSDLVQEALDLLIQKYSNTE